MIHKRNCYLFMKIVWMRIWINLDDLWNWTKSSSDFLFSMAIVRLVRASFCQARSFRTNPALHGQFLFFFLFSKSNVGTCGKWRQHTAVKSERAENLEKLTIWIQKLKRLKRELCTSTVNAPGAFHSARGDATAIERRKKFSKQEKQISPNCEWRFLLKFLSKQALFYENVAALLNHFLLKLLIWNFSLSAPLACSTTQSLCLGPML